MPAKVALLALLSLGLFLLPAQGTAQEKSDLERAKELQRELNLNHEEMVKLLQVNREEIKRAMARLASPGPFRPATTAVVTRPDLARDYRFGVLFGLPHAVLQEQLKLEQGQGLIVVEVTADSAAVKAGVKANDILIELNGKKVPSDFAAYGALVREIKIDQQVPGVVLRKGVRENVQVTLPNVILVPVATGPNCPTGYCPSPALQVRPGVVPIQPVIPPVVDPVKGKN